MDHANQEITLRERPIRSFQEETGVLSAASSTAVVIAVVPANAIVMIGVQTTMIVRPHPVHESRFVRARRLPETLHEI